MIFYNTCKIKYLILNKNTKDSFFKKIIIGKIKIKENIHVKCMHSMPHSEFKFKIFYI